jgi:hypothetical protein
VEVLESVESSPLDAQRVIVHSRLGRKRLRRAASFVWPEEFRRFATKGPDIPLVRPDEIQWFAVWSDFEPSNEGERRLAARIGNAAPVEILEGAGAAVRVYHME